jgi:hypothetical protein
MALYTKIKISIQHNKNEQFLPSVSKEGSID